MKKICLMLVIFILSAKSAFAAELNLATENLICAFTSLSAYSGEESLMARNMLLARDWSIDAITTENSRAFVKAYLISKDNIKILVISGTEDLKDVEVDFRVGRVPLHEDENFDANDANKIFVHRGFRDYTDSALDGGVKDYLLNELKNNPAEKLYITGHSLGGAVALMTAIRLCDSGAPMDRIKVITFGAPSIGNRALAEQYQDKINLTRVTITGDPIKRSLQVLGYVHFGEVVNYPELPTPNHNAHKMILYLDAAIRNFYSLNPPNLPPEVENKAVYVAPVTILKNSFNAEDEKFILQILSDGLKSRLINLTFDNQAKIEIKKADQFSYSVSGFLEQAKKFDCKFILVQYLYAKPVREAQHGEKRVTLEELLFSADGELLSMQTSMPTTENLTLIEAAAFAQENLRSNRERILCQ